MKTGLETAVEIPARMVNRTAKRSGSTVDTSPGQGPRQSGPVEPTGLVEPTEPMEPVGTRGTAETWDGLNVSFPPLRPPGIGGSRPGEMGTAPGTPEDPPPAAPTPSPEALSAQIDPAAQVLAVTGARGGLGVSVLLLHLAWALMTRFAASIRPATSFLWNFIFMLRQIQCGVKVTRSGTGLGVPIRDHHGISRKKPK